MNRVASSLRLINSRRKAEDTTIRSNLAHSESTGISSKLKEKKEEAFESSRELQNTSCYSIKSAPRVSAQPKLLKILFSKKPGNAESYKPAGRGPLRAKPLLAKPVIPLGSGAPKEDKTSPTSQTSQGQESHTTRSSEFLLPEQRESQAQVLESGAHHRSPKGAVAQSPTQARELGCAGPDIPRCPRDPFDYSKLMNMELATPITLSRDEMNRSISQRIICRRAILKKPAGACSIREAEESPSAVSYFEPSTAKCETEKTSPGSKKVSFSRNKMIRVFQRQSTVPSSENY